MKITPEKIFYNFSQYLRTKYNKYLSFVIFSCSAFEKWLQWEFYLSQLSQKEELIPIAYGQDWTELETNGDYIADIRPECLLRGVLKGKKGVKTDFFIAETPFLKALVDQKDWKIKKGCEKKAEKKYLSSLYHYIELKNEWYMLGGKREKELPAGWKKDIDKKIIAVKKDFKKKPISGRTYMAISLVTFYKKGVYKIPQKEMDKQLSTFKNKIKNDYKNYNLIFLSDHIKGDTYLLCVYRNFQAA